MSNIIISDTTCLIGLSKIGELDILRQLFGKVIIPPAVYHEVVVLGAGRVGAEAVKQALWIEIWPVKNQLAVQVFHLSLGSGESEAIVLATECQAEFIILDDWKARQSALSLALPVIGTMAILVKAEQKGLIPSANILLEKLKEAGFRFPNL